MGQTDENEDEAARALARVEHRLDGVEGALRRLEEGTYGRCASCGEAIAEDRLRDDPVTSWCGRCAPREGAGA